MGEMGLKEEKIDIIITYLADARRRNGSVRFGPIKQKKEKDSKIIKRVNKKYYCMNKKKLYFCWTYIIIANKSIK